MSFSLKVIFIVFRMSRESSFITDGTALGYEVEERKKCLKIYRERGREGEREKSS